MFKSATFKLTLWYLAIVMIISLGFSTALYHFGTNELSSGLQHQTQRIFRRYPVFTNDPNLQPQAPDVDAGAHHLLLQLVYFNLLVLAGAGFASYWLARRTLEPIEIAHEQQKRFTADVSHELRTPLTSLKMGSEVALMDPTASKDELRQALESSLEDAAKMDQLINNLLRLTRLDADQAKTQFSQTSSTLITTSALAQIAGAATVKDITIKSQIDDVALVADQDALVQLLVILLDNAIKYSKQKSVIVLEAHKQAQNVTFSVADQGEGIAAEALPHVFDRFYRADKARTKTETDGFGLGLSIAKLIADRHDGSITLTSRPGKGTTATITLPQPKPQSPASAAAAN